MSLGNIGGGGGGGLYLKLHTGVPKKPGIFAVGFLGRFFIAYAPYFELCRGDSELPGLGFRV